MKKMFLLEAIAVFALLLVSVPSFGITANDDWTADGTENEPMVEEESVTIEPVLMEEDFYSMSPEDEEEGMVILDEENGRENGDADFVDSSSEGFNGFDEDFNE
jgi:hypothetical protein